MNDTNTQRQQVVYATNDSMNLIVTSPMPLLDVKCSGFPKTMVAGEVKSAVLTLSNRGQKPLSGLQVRLSHPAFFYFGRKEDLEQDIYHQSSIDGSSAISKSESPNHLFDPAMVTIRLPERDGRSSLLPGETTQIPFWIRGDRVGSYNFQFLFSYETEVGAFLSIISLLTFLLPNFLGCFQTKNPVLKSRFLRWELATTISPSIRISAVTRQSAKTINQYVVSIEVLAFFIHVRLVNTQKTAIFIGNMIGGKSLVSGGLPIEASVFCQLGLEGGAAELPSLSRIC